MARTIRSSLQFLAALASVVVASLVLRAHLKQPEANIRFFDASTTLTWSFVVFLPDARDEAFGKLLRDAISEVAELADESSIAFSTVGVVMNLDVSNGLRLADYYGPFDEIIVGRDILNTAVPMYVVREGSGSVMTPQVSVVEIGVNIEPGAITFGVPRVLARHDGLLEIRVWQQSGFAVPRS
jgi:hypothetical protein